MVVFFVGALLKGKIAMQLESVEPIHKGHARGTGRKAEPIDTGVHRSADHCVLFGKNGVE